MNTNTLPDDSAALSVIGPQKSVNKKNEIEELEGLMAELQKKVQDIRDICIEKQRSTPVIFAEKVDIYKEINCLKKRRQLDGNREVDRDADRINTTHETEKNVYYVPSISKELCKYAKIIVND